MFLLDDAYFSGVCVTPSLWALWKIHEAEERGNGHREILFPLGHVSFPCFPCVLFGFSPVGASVRWMRLDLRFPAHRRPAGLPTHA